MPSVVNWIRDSLLHTSPWVGVLGLLLLVTTGCWMGLRVARFGVARRAARSRRLGRGGEAKALAMLRRSGFRIVETEARAEGLIEVDGRIERFVVRADALVERAGRVYVAELKGGPEAGKVTNRATRRQLLEYAVVFDVAGILLVDAYGGRIHVVRFGA